ncbi:MAG: cysteine peptidase family C39 domain-containing protein, partial [Bryobacteraceae bacterium]
MARVAAERVRGESVMRRFLIPEVVQTSAMDCGPASLKALLEGHGIRASYGRLREACQTDLDGTSIDAIEDAAVQLGLDAEQVMVPVDHLLLDEARVLPALIVVKLPNNATHFVVVWRRHGNWLQIMDPGTGRRWSSLPNFLEEVFVHTQPVPAAGWRAYASSDGFLKPLRRRLSELGVWRPKWQRLIRQALEDEGWQRLAALDAATRMVEALVRSDGLRPGRAAGRLVESLAGRPDSIPPIYWS